MGLPFDNSTLRRARNSRDARFDGLFFVGVKSTGIYCRPICPAKSPLEKNVAYFVSAVSAAHAGFRPCLRCRPDAAPLSSAWQGTQTSFQRALKLINEGALQDGSLTQLSNRLGISDRYLRRLFDQHLGTSPKKYAIYQQCLFAKQLLHQSQLSITDIAYAAGFNSIRRFNEAMREQIGLAPREIRKSSKTVTSQVQLKLSYRPPFDWTHSWRFLKNRMIPGLEWVVDNCYYRTIEYQSTRGYFSVQHAESDRCLRLHLQLDDYRFLNPITQRLRAIFDVDAPIAQIDTQLREYLKGKLRYQAGIRMPGIWHSFEAGVRAVLGQQVAVKHAQQLVSTLVDNLGETLDFNGLPEALSGRKLFPTPAAVASSDLAFLRMPRSRRATLKSFAEHVINAENPEHIDDWISIKGVGPWTINYAKMRAAGDPDVWLAGDAGIKNALARIKQPIEPDRCAPWRSYLTLQLWNQLALRTDS